jgi:hypothetical protein
MTSEAKRAGRASRLSRVGIVLALVGIAAAAVFGVLAYIGAVWGFIAMDNPPPGQPYWVLWDVGRVGLLAGVVAAAIGATLAVVTRLATLARRRHDASPRED